VERRVEHGDVRQRRKAARRADALHARVVQRREHRQLVDVDLDEIVDERRAEEAGAALDDAVPHRRRRGLDQRRTVLLERVEHHAEAGGVVGDRQFARVIGIPTLWQPSRSPADALDETRRERRLGLDVDELILERRGAAVDDEDDGHALIPCCWFCAWIAVMAIVLTMSSTSAPRDRSLMGLLSPWSTGPMATAPAALHRLVGVVAGVEVGEDEHRRPAGDGESGIFALATAASAAASYWIGPSTSSSGARSRTNAVASRTLSTSSPTGLAGGVRQHRDARLDAELTCRGGRRDGDVRQLRRSGRDHGAVAVDEHAVGERHEEHWRRLRRPDAS
jgi:hypothetical protein